MKTRFQAWLSLLQRRPVILFLLFWFLTVLLYLPAWKGGFMLDFQGWLEMYRDNDFLGILNRKGTDIHSLYYLTQLQLYVWTRLFGIHPLPWFLLFTALQALNGTLLFTWSSRLFKDLGLRGDRWIALLGTLLFLLSPNMTEVVVWKAAYHYLTGLQLILWILLLCQQFLYARRPRHAWVAGLLFFLSTFTLELFYTTPWLVLFVLIAYFWAGRIDRERFQKGLRYFFLPQLLLFVVHLLLYFSIYGKWIAHSAYDSSGKVSFAILVSRILHYEFHLLFFGRFFPNEVRNWVYHSFAERPPVYIALFVLILSFAVYALLRFRKAGLRFRIAALLVACSLLTLAIVLHFMVYDILLVINDRYLYLTSAFQCLLVAVLLSSLFRYRILFAGLALVLITVYTVLTVKLVLQWRQATKIFYGVQRNFRWKEAPAVLLLNIPCTYNGIGIINAGTIDGFNPHLRIFTGDTAKGRLYDVSSYNMQQPWDGAHVTVLDSLHLKVTLNQWGAWWWYGTYGATDYENDLYAVHFTDPSHEYVLTLKQYIPGMVILFQQGEQWKEVDMSRPGAEQW